MRTRQKFRPEVGKVYQNNGGLFICLVNTGDYDAVMQNVASRWTVTAHGCGIYPDGTIDWDFSTGGYFA